MGVLKMKEKLIKNKTFRKVLVVTFIFIIVTFLYGFVLLRYDLTLTNTYDYKHNLNPCTSENEYNGISRVFVCMIYYEEVIINKIFGGV